MTVLFWRNELLLYSDSNCIFWKKSGSAMSYCLSKAPAVGASGAIFGLVSYAILLNVTGLANWCMHLGLSFHAISWFSAPYVIQLLDN